jgi:hypothetical protein
MVRGLVAEPGLIADLPRWVRDAGIRKDPLSGRRPWWNYRAIAHVDAYLAPGALVFEFGGGASTLWLRDRGAVVTTIEHDQGWYDGLVRLPGRSDVRLVPVGPDGGRAYIHSVDGEADGSLDLVIVDGEHRDACVLAARVKVRPGGLLLLDDTQHSDVRASSRAEREQMRPEWAHLESAMSDWTRMRFRGLKPGTWLPVETTLWQRPVGRS